MSGGRSAVSGSYAQNAKAHHGPGLAGGDSSLSPLGLLRLLPHCWLAVIRI
jgi:hypothetical protein